MLLSHPLTEEHKREICAWAYPGEYALYDLPPYEVMRGEQRGFCHPERQDDYRGFSEDGKLVGYIHLVEKDRSVFIGVGVAPELCGQGYGSRMLLQAQALSCARYPGKPLYLEVRTWNLQAIRCYEKAGFGIEGEAFEQVTGSGKGMFYRMVLD